MLKKTILTVAAFAAFAALGLAQEPPPKITARAGTNTNTNRVASPALKQADIASKTAKFGLMSKTNELYAAALDAHALDAALKQADKEGAFKGKVAAIYEPRSGAMAILNFDEKYRTALTALLKKENFAKFPALTNLLNKEVLVTGTFTNFQGRAEIILTNAAQVKLVE